MNQDFRNTTKNKLWNYIRTHFDDEIASDTFIERFSGVIPAINSANEYCFCLFGLITRLPSIEIVD